MKRKVSYSLIDIEHNRLKELVTYNPLTGKFTRNITRGRWKVGDEIKGSIDREGYVIISLDYRDYRSHRLAYFYMTGEWPKTQIDHKDRNPQNNKWNNLRLSDNSKNSFNQKKKGKDRSLPKGVWTQYGRFYASCGSIYLGSFNTIEEAELAHIKKAKELFGDHAPIETQNKYSLLEGV